MAQNKVKTPTPEQQKEMLMRAYLQKKASIAEGVLFNMFQGAAGSDTTMGAEMAVRLANEVATEFMKVIYNQEVKTTEE